MIENNVEKFLSRKVIYISVYLKIVSLYSSFQEDWAENLIKSLSYLLEKSWEAMLHLMFSVDKEREVLLEQKGSGLSTVTTPSPD